MRTWILTAVVAAAAVGDGRAEYPTLKARPKPPAGIPNYPYEPANPPPRAGTTGTGQSRLTLRDNGTTPAVTPAGGPVIVTREVEACRAVSTLCKSERTLTRERVTTATPAPGPVPSELATFTLRERTLVAGAGQVSGVSVVLSPDGKYAVRYRAEALPDRAAGLGPQRQLFQLTIRGYATDPLGEAVTTATRATVVQIPLEGVWVNRSEPRSEFVEGTSEAVRRNFKWIDRIEVDFTTR